MQALEDGPTKLRIVLDVDNHQADLADEGIDLSIRCGRGKIPGRISVQLFEEHCFPVASPALAAKIGKGQPERLLKYPLIHDSDASAWRAWFAAHGMDYRPRPEDRRFEDYNLVLDAAAHGLGIALARPPLTVDQLAGQAASWPATNAPRSIRCPTGWTGRPAAAAPGRGGTGAQDRQGGRAATGQRSRSRSWRPSGRAYHYGSQPIVRAMPAPIATRRRSRGDSRHLVEGMYGSIGNGRVRTSATIRRDRHCALPAARPSSAIACAESRIASVVIPRPRRGTNAADRCWLAISQRADQEGDRRR